MTNFKLRLLSPKWLFILLATALLAGCGGDWDPVPGADNGNGNGNGPSVTASSPADNATDVALDAPVTYTFSEAMDADSIDAETFTLVGPDDAGVVGTITYASASNTATFTPESDLEPGSLYTATVTTGVHSSVGDSLAADHSWRFTTALEDEPLFISVAATNPMDEGMVCTERAIRVSFDHPLDPVSIVSPATHFGLTETVNTSEVDGEVSLNDEGSTATFTPEFPLSAGVEYTATVTTDVTDENGRTLENAVVWTFTASDDACQPAITLGAIQTFGVLSNTGVTLGGGPDSTTGLRIDGDVGIFPAGACIGCDSTTVSGDIDIGNTVASDAMDALEAAYNEAINLAAGSCTLIDSGVLTTNPSATCGGSADGVFKPGLYWSGTSIAIPAGGTITLDAQNDADAVFIFQSESTIDTIGGDTHIILENGAQAQNVFWVAGSSATIGGTNSDFVGTIMAQIGITVNTGTEMVGRALARGAEVTVQDGALITVPTE